MNNDFYVNIEVRSDRGREYDQSYTELLPILQARIPFLADNLEKPALPPFGTFRMFCFARMVIKAGIKEPAVYAYAVLPVQSNNFIQAQQLFYENYPEFDHLLFIFWDNGDLARNLCPDTPQAQDYINTARFIMQKNDWLPYNSPWFMGDGED